MSRAERCYCGHDIASHYRDHSTGRRHDCLAMGCDCGAYVYEDDHASARGKQLTAPRGSPRRTVKKVHYTYFGRHETSVEVDPSGTCKGGEDCRCFAP